MTTPRRSVAPPAGSSLHGGPQVSIDLVDDSNFAHYMQPTGRDRANSRGSSPRRLSPRARVVLKPLPFAYDALEPVLSRELMSQHYEKHHKAHVRNLNSLNEQAEAAVVNGDHARLVELQNDIKCSGGGHLNHEFLWDTLTPVKHGGGILPARNTLLHFMLLKEYKTVEAFIAAFNAKAGIFQGSGWAWLAYSEGSFALEIHVTENHDRLADIGKHLVPLLTIDLWEHAYYWDYHQNRAEYLKRIWRVINWKKVSERLEQACYK